MKNLLLRKGAMVLAVSIALSSAVLGTNAFADTSKKVENEDEIKFERLVGSSRCIDIESIEKLSEEELEKLIGSEGIKMEEGECISGEMISAFSIDNMYDSYVKDGVLTQKEANKLKEVEKQVEKLYNKLDLSACNGDMDKINAAFEEVSKKEDELRKTVSEIMKKIGMEIINGTSEMLAIPMELDGNVMKIENIKDGDMNSLVESTSENVLRGFVGTFKK